MEINNKLEIQIARREDIDLLLPTILELRPHLTKETFGGMFNKQQNEGYQMVFVGDGEMAFALAGFRSIHTFFSGKTLYIDDLVTHSSHKNKGYAGLLMDWIKDYARENQYDHLSLDSGFQRKDAHRLYLSKGLEVESLHFGRKVVDLS